MSPKKRQQLSRHRNRHGRRTTSVDVATPVEKAPTLTPGARSAPINPGFGGMGAPEPPPGSPRQALPPGDFGARGGPLGPNQRPGDRGTVTTPVLQPGTYNDRVGSQPPNNITDVDIGANWFSPFQPIVPFGPPYVGYPRTYDYQVGQNIDFLPSRLAFFGQLRAMAQSWGLLRTVIETRKDQLMRIPWDFQVVDKPKAQNPRLDELRAFFKRPDRKFKFDPWARKLLEDLFVIDAPAVYVWRAANGKPYCADVIDGACYSDDTEVLTRRGWLRFDETNVDDEFATRNPGTKAFEWQKSTYHHVQDWTGRRMVALRSRTLDLLVTPTHRVLVCARDGGQPEQVKQAHEFVGSCVRWCIPQTSTWVGMEIDRKVFSPDRVRASVAESAPRGRLPGTGRPGLRGSGVGVVKTCETCSASFVVHPYRKETARFCCDRCRHQGHANTVEMTGDDYCAFMGMYLAEGCYTNGDQVMISQQSKSKGFGPFGDLIRRIFGREVCHTGSSWVLGCRVLHDYLEQFGRAHQKFVPTEIKEATPVQLKLFWDFYLLGDGCLNGGRESSITASEQLADDLQEIAQKLGFSAGVYPRANEAKAAIGGRVINSRPEHYTVRRRDTAHIGITEAEFVEGYAGKVYCVSVPNEALYVRRNGRPTWCLNTIKPYIDDAGRRPDYPSPAYAQIIKGLPMINLDEMELIYAPMRPRPQMPIFGYSPVEQIYLEVVQGIRKTLYTTEFWTEGNIPDLIVTVPDEWTPQQIASFQGHFDAMLSGNTAFKSKMRFVPGGMKPFDIKNSNGESLKTDQDEWLARIVCYSFSVNPSPFIRQMNRATAQNAAEEAEEEGLHPLLTWFKSEFMDPLVQDEIGFGYDDIEFVWKPEPEVDPVKQMTVLTGYMKAGVKTPDEVREELNLPPLPNGAGAEAVVETATGPVPFAETKEAARAKALDVPNELQRTQDKHDSSMDAQAQSLQQGAENHKVDLAAKKKPPAAPGKAPGSPGKPTGKFLVRPAPLPQAKGKLAYGLPNERVGTSEAARYPAVAALAACIRRSAFGSEARSTGGAAGRAGAGGVR